MSAVRGAITVFFFSLPFHPKYEHDIVSYKRAPGSLSRARFKRKIKN